MRSFSRWALCALCFLCSPLQPAAAAPWIAANWEGREPEFPPGSLYWHTNRYTTSPVLYRRVISVSDQPVAFAGFRARASRFAYVFLNGAQIAAAGGETFAVELTHLLKAGRNVLVISAGEDGFSLEGGIAHGGGTFEPIGTDTSSWRVQKFPPLIIPEREPFMEPDFNDSGWFGVERGERPGVSIEKEELEKICAGLASERLAALDGRARWRLNLLRGKGIAVVDWEAHGWGGPGRLPGWLLDLAGPGGKGEREFPGSEHLRAEALCLFSTLRDEAMNLELLSAGLAALESPAGDVDSLRGAARAMQSGLAEMEASLRAKNYEEALKRSGKIQAAGAAARKGRLLNRLNRTLDNKFSWFDTTELLDSDPAGWGLTLGSPARIFASPLSPAALVTLEGKEFTLQGWDGQAPLRVYDRNSPPATGPVCIWAVVEGKEMVLRPRGDGTVYEREKQGHLTENWVLLVSDMARGGNLPVEIVFLDGPARIGFDIHREKGTRAVKIDFDEPGRQLFLLRPLKEWRGFLAMAGNLTQYPRKGAGKGSAPTAAPLDGKRAAPYLQAIRLWSRGVLSYPVDFSEASVLDREDRYSLVVADVYRYREFRDRWNTKPLRLAPLPPLATYGMMVGYPGLEVRGSGEVMGSRGIWGDLVAARGQSHVIYRVPLHRIKRFGGFTSYCFGPTDIGGPGSEKEIETIRRTGSNSFRPQHNQTGERAMKTAEWCRQQGIQNVFNTDEKWVPDVVEHYRTLARKCRDFPPDAIAYDLLNEPETREPRAYGALIKKITAAIREVDKSHLIYVEAMPAWGPGAKPFPRGAFETLEPTGDALTVYSFHDYDFRLGRIQSRRNAGNSGGPARWPNESADRRDLLSRWIPAFRYSIDHRAPIHLGEFGGFEQVRGQDIYENRCAETMMMDFFSIFDQFGWHWHYYANRGTLRTRKDGSLEESHVQKAFRRYFERGTFNAHRG